MIVRMSNPFYPIAFIRSFIQKIREHPRDLRETAYVC